MSKGKRITTPLNRKTLTNIAIVRLKIGGKRFELACYPNKVEEWKRGIETNIREVIQTNEIFDNVSRGVTVNPIDLSNIFNTEDKEEVIRVILERGEIQVSEQERKNNYDNIFKDIATIIIEKCVNSETGQSLSRGVVESAMRQIHYSVKKDKSAKQQALQVIKLLQESEIIPIERAKMRLQFLTTSTKLEEVKESLKDLITIENEKIEEGNAIIIALSIPSNYREIGEISKNQGINIEVLDHAVKPEDEGGMTNNRNNTNNEDDEN